MQSYDADLDELEFDILKEIGNIGAGNATTALSSMLHAKIDMHVPKVNMLSFKELGEIVGGAETLVAGILLSLSGDVEGMMLFMLEYEAARHLVCQLMGIPQEEENVEFTDMAKSALQEIGNIISGAYLSAISSLTNLTIISSVPYLSIDMAGAILSVPAIEFGKLGDRALLIESQFKDLEVDISGYFILIPTLESNNRILSSLGM